MQKNAKIWAVVLSAGILTACGDNPAKETSEQPGKNAETTAPAVTSGVITLNDDKLNAVYQHYVHLTKALVAGDAADAKIAGNAIETGAGDIQGGEQIASSAAKITAATDIEVQRKEYAVLSDQFIALAKKSGLKNGELYVEYCPMAMNDKGAYWLSETKEIKNPYFGDRMLTCGEVKETLN